MATIALLGVIWRYVTGDMWLCDRTGANSPHNEVDGTEATLGGGMIREAPVGTYRGARGSPIEREKYVKQNECEQKYLECIDALERQCRHGARVHVDANTRFERNCICTAEGRERVLSPLDSPQMYLRWEQIRRRRCCVLDGVPLSFYYEFHFHKEFGEYMVKFRQPYRIHAYWNLHDILSSWDMTSADLNQLLKIRTRNMATQWKEYRRDDFKIEKSKCVMYRYFECNNVPHPNVIRYWDDDRSFFANLSTVPSTLFPAILKFCHLTQGGQFKGGNTKYFHSQSSLLDFNLKDYVGARWSAVAHENKRRPWVNDGVKDLLETLDKGIMFQEAWPLASKWAGGPQRPLEVKVICIWGRCQSLRIEEFTGPGRYPYAFRDGFGRPRIFQGSSKASDMRIVKAIPDIYTHLEAAFELAERNVKILQIDFMRVDIFLNPNNPLQPVINEHSIYELGSVWRHDYHKHIAFFWRLGYLNLTGKLEVSPYSPTYGCREGTRGLNQ